MATPANRKEYLKKYLSTGKDKKNKKKHKSKDKNKVKRLKLVEEDNNLPFDFDDEDDAPTIAEITYDDERMKIAEDFTNNKWKALQDLQGIGSNSQPSSVPAVVPEQKSNFGYPNDKSSRSSKKNSSGIESSLPRKKYSDQPKGDKYGSPRRKRNDSDTTSPSRKTRCSASPGRKFSDLEINKPSRNKRHTSDTSKLDSPNRRKRHDSDDSPSRKQRHDSDNSPPRNQRHDSDNSPPRKQRHDSDNSPPRKQRHDSDSPPRRKQRHNSDNSPPRKQRHDSDNSPPRKQRHDSDNSPPRKQRHNSDENPPRRKRHDSDESPPRRKRHDSDSNPPGRKKKSEPAKQEIQIRPERKLTTAEFLRARKSGKLKEKSPEELLKKAREEVLQKEANDKYKHWNKGVVQEQKMKDTISDTVHEMGKKFARSADDNDMNLSLKGVLREEDPMLAYIMEKKRDQHKGPQKPLYQGSFPPNRFNIRPGYRWDGVDRSSGFEQKWFEQQNSKKAIEEDSYKWSVEDM